MSICATCSKKIIRSQIYVECSGCDMWFHGACVNLKDSDIDFLKKENKPWNCDDCHATRRKSIALEEATAQGKITLEDVVKILNDMRLDSKNMEKNLGQSINFCHERMEDVLKKIDEQEKLLKDYREKIEVYETDIKALKSRNEDLENRLIEVEQYTRINCLEVHGIPYDKNEDPESIVISVGQALGCTVKNDMIEACHRLRKNPDEKNPAPIIVKFLKRSVKEEIIQRRRVKRDFSTRHMGLPTDIPVYINESLCPARRMVFGAARRAKLDKGYKYLWIRNGRIFARKNDGGQVLILRNLSDVLNMK